MSDEQLTTEQRLAILRRPPTRGILASNSWGGTMAHGGSGERPSMPVYGKNRNMVVGSRAKRLSDGIGF